MVAFAGNHGSFALLLVFGVLPGHRRHEFAVGIPFVNAWYDAPRRGFATGVFGAGMGGTALSAFFTPRFVNWFGEHADVRDHGGRARGRSAVVCWTMMRDSPRWTPEHRPRSTPKLVAALKLPVTWELSFLYAVVFGGFVAFSTYLPTYLNTSTASPSIDAGGRTAGLLDRGRRRATGRRRPLRPDRPQAGRAGVPRRRRRDGRGRRDPARSRTSAAAPRSC